MQFWHRLALAQLIMLAAVVFVAAASHYQVRGLYHAVVESSEEYGELRALAAANAALSDARTQVWRQGAMDETARKKLAEAKRILDQYLILQVSQKTNMAHQEEETVLASQCSNRIETILNQPSRGTTSHGNSSADSQLNLIGLAILDLQKLLSSMDAIVADAHHVAEMQLVRSRRWELTVPVIALFLTSFAGLWQYFSVIRPVKLLKDGASRMARGDLSVRVDESSRDEIGSLSADFNKMASELEVLYRNLDDQVRKKSRELAHAERLTSVGLLAAGIAHEINNPLSIIHGYAQEARQYLIPVDASSGKLAAVLDVIMEESQRCRDIVRRLLTLASPGDSSRTSVDMQEVIRATIGTIADLPQYRERRIETDLSAPQTTIRANRDEIKQVVLNLIINGLEATGPQGVVRVSCSSHGNDVITVFSDDGCGMTAETLLRVFDPFYTTRNSHGHRGVGLGLSVSYAIIQQHGGQLSAQSDGPERGSRFTISLPADTCQRG